MRATYRANSLPTGLKPVSCAFFIKLAPSSGNRRDDSDARRTGHGSGQPYQHPSQDPHHRGSHQEPQYYPPDVPGYSSMNLPPLPPQPFPYAQTPGAQPPRLPDPRPPQPIAPAQTPYQQGYPTAPFYHTPVDYQSHQGTPRDFLPGERPIYPSNPDLTYSPPEYHGHSLRSHVGHGHYEQPQQNLERSRRGAPSYRNMVGAPGYPEPAERCQERARFTSEDDQKLKLLKETKTLSWRQIQDFFPGRKSGTLQVRYCTKLKDKRQADWDRELDEKLKKAMKDDKNNKWSRVAQKVGNNVTAQACQDRWTDLESLENEPDDEAYE